MQILGRKQSGVGTGRVIIQVVGGQIPPGKSANLKFEILCLLWSPQFPETSQGLPSGQPGALSYALARGGRQGGRVTTPGYRLV